MHLWLDVSDSLQMLGGPSATVQVEWVTSGVEPGGYLPCSQQAACSPQPAQPVGMMPRTRAKRTPQSWILRFFVLPCDLRCELEFVSVGGTLQSCHLGARRRGIPRRCCTVRQRAARQRQLLAGAESSELWRETCLSVGRPAFVPSGPRPQAPPPDPPHHRPTGIGRAEAITGLWSQGAPGK